MAEIELWEIFTCVSPTSCSRPPSTTTATMLTRSSVLGKRGHHESSSPAPSTKSEQLQTPDRTPNPKRARTTLLIDDDSNKENIPPFITSPVSANVTPRSARALRRNATEMITPRSRPGALGVDENFFFHVLIFSHSPSTKCVSCVSATRHTNDGYLNACYFNPTSNSTRIFTSSPCSCPCPSPIDLQQYQC